MTKRDETLGHTSIMTHAQIVRRAKAIVQAALDERDKAIDEAQGMLCVVAAVMMKNGGEIILTQDDLDNAPRNLAFETDEKGTRRICAFEMRERDELADNCFVLPDGACVSPWECSHGPACAGDPQTALYLGSKLDPNDATVNWTEECDRLMKEHKAAHQPKQQKQVAAPPEQKLLTATTGEQPAVSRTTTSGSKIELL